MRPQKKRAINRGEGVPRGVMESSYSIEPGENLVRLKVWGELTAEGLVQLMMRAGSDPRFIPGMHAIADYREAQASWDYSEIQRFRDYVAQIAMPSEVRWAAVVRPGRLAVVGHILIVISDALQPKVRMQMFEDPHKALRWIRGEIS
jgi:hypothetical protein